MECLKLLMSLIELASTTMAIIGSLFTSVAIVVGGWWTWSLYVRQRLGYPKITIVSNIFTTCLPENKRLIHVSLKITNAGNVIFSTQFAELRLRKVVPIDETVSDVLIAASQGRDSVPRGRQEIEWPLIAGREWKFPNGKFEIEPGEEDSLHADYIIDAGISVIQLYCFVRNQKKPEIGWTATQMYELTSNQKGNKMPENNDDKRTILNEQQQQQLIQQPQQKQQEQQQQQQQQQQQKPPVTRQDKK